MTLQGALGILIGTAGLLGAGGTAVGFGLGRFNPGYYRAVFVNGADPEFDPVAVGVGLGLTQGTAAGLVVGLALVALLCWRDIRLSRAPGAAAPAGGAVDRSRGLLLASGLLVGMAVSCAGGCALGTGLGDMWEKHRRFAEQREAVAPVLASDPGFKDAHVDDGHSGTGRMLICGHVRTQSDLDRLQDRLVRALGEVGAKYAVRGVHVEVGAEPDVARERRPSK
jgi:hypothetical protein